VVEQLHGVAVQALLIGVREDLRQRSGHHRTRREYCSAKMIRRKNMSKVARIDVLVMWFLDVHIYPHFTTKEKTQKIRRILT